MTEASVLVVMRRGESTEMAGRWISLLNMTTLQFKCVLIKSNTAIFLLCRVDIRKGLNALKREIPGGDTFMHLGLQRVRLCRNAFLCYLTLRIKLFS